MIVDLFASSHTSTNVFPSLPRHERQAPLGPSRQQGAAQAYTYIPVECAISSLTTRARTCPSSLVSTFQRIPCLSDPEDNQKSSSVPFDANNNTTTTTPTMPSTLPKSHFISIEKFKFLMNCKANSGSEKALERWSHHGRHTPQRFPLTLLTRAVACHLRHHHFSIICATLQLQKNLLQQ